MCKSPKMGTMKLYGSWSDGAASPLVTPPPFTLASPLVTSFVFLTFPLATSFLDENNRLVLLVLDRVDESVGWTNAADGEAASNATANVRVNISLFTSVAATFQFWMQ